MQYQKRLILFRSYYKMRLLQELLLGTQGCLVFRISEIFSDLLVYSFMNILMNF